MTTVWKRIMKFPPTEAHLELWTKRVLAQINLPDYIKSITVEDLFAIIKKAQSLKNKGDNDAPKNLALGSPLLRSRWKELMDFTPSRLHIALLQDKVDSDLGVDQILEKAHYEELENIIGDVAIPPSPPAVPPTTTQK